MKKIIVLTCLMSFGALAQAYGPAGCGFGSAVFKDGQNEWWHQVLAATTNGTSGSQTFGITSGTLNCDATPLIKLGHVEQFIESNKNTVSNDLARGEGESLSVLAYAFNCSNSANLSSSLKKNYAKIFSNGASSAKQITGNINSVVGSVSGCSAI